MKKQLRPKIRTDGRKIQKLIDYDEDLNYICKRFSNPMQQYYSLCFKKSTCSEILYIIVNNSEHDEIITLSDQPYWTELFSGDKYDLITNFECKSQEFYLMYHTENNYV